MKPRTVLLSLELETDLPLFVLRQVSGISFLHDGKVTVVMKKPAAGDRSKVRQCSVQVAQPVAPEVTD